MEIAWREKGERERERESARERKFMCNHETMQTQKCYYILDMVYAYFPIDRRLCKKREREREQEREKVLCPSMKQ